MRSCRFQLIRGKVTWHKEADVKVEAEDAKIPLVFGLKPAYSNPFNPNVTLNYALTDDGRASLRVFNLRGQLEETLISTYALKGTYSVTWQPENLSADVYIIHMQSSNHTSMQRVLLVR